MKYLKKYNESESSVYYDIDIIESFLEGLEEIGFFVSGVFVMVHIIGSPNQQRFQSLYDAKKYLDQNSSIIGTTSYNILFSNFDPKNRKLFQPGAKQNTNNDRGNHRYKEGNPNDYQNMKNLIDVFKSRLSEFTNCNINNITISNDTKYQEQRSKGTSVIVEAFTISGQINLTNSAKGRINDKKIQ